MKTEKQILKIRRRKVSKYSEDIKADLEALEEER